MNRIARLEADLKHAAAARRADRSRRPDRASAPAPVPPTGSVPSPELPQQAGPVSHAVATAMAAWAGAPAPAGTGRRASRRRPGAFSVALDHRVPNLPMPLKQASSMLCWATVATMMASWRDQVSHSVEGYVSGLGEPWTSLLRSNTGLSAQQVPQLLATMGLQVETAAASFSAAAWERMLRDYGPLWVTADIDPTPGIQGAHAHIVVGIHGPDDGDPVVDVIDPMIGAEVSMPLSRFDAQYGQLAGTSFAGRQIRHWPEGAQRAAQQSLSWMRQAVARTSRQASPAGPVIAAAGLGWQVFREVVTGERDLKWTRTELRGTRIPGDDEGRRHLAAGEYSLGTATSKHTLQYDFAVVSDFVGAEFEIRYRHNGHCVRDVTITNVSHAPPGPLSGRALTVETSIVPATEHERGDVAAVEVEVTYHFSNVAGSQGTFVDRIVLFGDGRAPRQTTTERRARLTIPAGRPSRCRGPRRPGPRRARRASARAARSSGRRVRAAP